MPMEGLRMSEENHLLLPYCPYCGNYKGVGVCPDRNCHGHSQEKLMSYSASKIETQPKDRRGMCAICGEVAVSSCGSCYGFYCEKHSQGRERETLDSMNQRLGTCAVCGRLVCEHCWILDKKGKIMCLQHLEHVR